MNLSCYTVPFFSWDQSTYINVSAFINLNRVLALRQTLEFTENRLKTKIFMKEMWRVIKKKKFNFHFSSVKTSVDDERLLS